MVRDIYGARAKLPPKNKKFVASLGEVVESFRRLLFKAAILKKQLLQKRWSFLKASHELDIERTHLYRKMKKLGLQNIRSEMI